MFNMLSYESRLRGHIFITRRHGKRASRRASCAAPSVLLMAVVCGRGLGHAQGRSHDAGDVVGPVGHDDHLRALRHVRELADVLLREALQPGAATAEATSRRLSAVAAAISR